MSEENTTFTVWDENNSVDIKKESDMIWNIANKLRGPYTSDKYKDVILPMVVIRRFECALEDTKEEVLKNKDNYPDEVLYTFSKHQFYNKSDFTLKKLLDDQENIVENFKKYINAFSPNVVDIIKNLDFEREIEKLYASNRLNEVIQKFSEVDLNPKNVDNIKMGYIFEDLIRRFSENAEAGDHYTGRDIIRLMVSLVLSEGCEDVLNEKQKIVKILDQAAGTGGMLTTAMDYILHENPDANVKLYSQEVNPESYALCLAEMLIRGQDTSNIKLQDTMISDCFEDEKMRFLFENPPFGLAWKGEKAAEGVENAVNQEAKKENGRFPAGVPNGGDMQLLFLQSSINKLADNGRAAIISNGSPLFSGTITSGNSKIRKWILENDYVESIIQLSDNMFYNTGISTYIWIISKNKSEKRRGKIQLIDASSFKKKLGNSLGNKQYEIRPEHIEKITKLYHDFEENEYSKIYDNQEFILCQYTIEQPLQRNYAITEERINKMSESNLSSFFNKNKYEELLNKELNGEKIKKEDKTKLEKFRKNESTYYAIMDSLTNNISDEIYTTSEEFEPILLDILKDIFNSKKELTNKVNQIMKGLSVRDETLPPERNKRGGVRYDTEPDSKITEIIPSTVNINEYFEKEVLPFVNENTRISAKKDSKKEGAEISFNKCFYKYQKPTSSNILLDKFLKLEKMMNEKVNKLGD